MKKLGFSVALFVLGLVLNSGCATAKAETNGEYIDDTAITGQANAIIISDPDAKFMEIETTSTCGDVVLRGFVKNKDSELRIVSQIQELSGVKSVKSQLRLEENWRVARESKQK